MARVKVKINLDGIRAFNHQWAVVSEIESMGRASRDTANRMCSSDRMRNMPFEMVSSENIKWPVVSVFAASPHGKYAQAKNRVLSKAINEARR